MHRRNIVKWLTRCGVRAAVVFAVLIAAAAFAREPEVDRKSDLYNRSHIGPLADGRVIVPTNQILSPAGRQVIVGGRPTDVALSPNRKWLAVLNVNQVQLVDVASA